MTAQVEEVLIIDGVPQRMAFCPPLPESDPRLVEVSDDEAKRNILSTACWRGYIGTWEIRDGRFYLVSVEGCYRLDCEAPLFADWFTGVLRIPQGELLQYVHQGYASVYERELHIKIEDGLVTKSRIIDNRGKEIGPEGLGWLTWPDMRDGFPGDDEL